MIAEIIINSNAKQINRIFDYIVPKTIQERITIGARVYVPFGRQKLQEGFVINLKEKSQYANKEIIEIRDNILDDEKMELAKLMARRYFCNISDCIKLMLPPGNKTIDVKVKEKQEKNIHLIESIDINQIKSEKQKQAIEFLQGHNGITIKELKEAINISEDIIKRMERNNYVKFVAKRVERNPFMHKSIKRDVPLKLTEEQQKAYEKITNSKYNQFLIYGITGSRKNRSVLAGNSKSFRNRENCYCFSTRNITYTSNGR